MRVSTSWVRMAGTQGGAGGTEARLSLGVAEVVSEGLARPAIPLPSQRTEATARRAVDRGRPT